MEKLPIFKTVLLKVDERGVAYLTLNRPEAHNALSSQLINELHQACDWLTTVKGSVRVVVLTGSGETFCAGGDLRWMQENMEKTRAERISESSELASMLRAINELPMLVIGRINGSAYGGGVGMISVCDIAIAVDTGMYALTEVRLGLLPANISPYVVRRMGEANARRTFLNGHAMTASKAQRTGLVSEVVGCDQLDLAVEREVEDLLCCACDAVEATKELINYVYIHDLSDSIGYAIEKLADAWETEEGREGVEAFFARRAPTWRER